MNESIDIVACTNDVGKFNSMVMSLDNSLSAYYKLNYISISSAESICKGYAEGLKRSSSDWIVFCHDDIVLLEFNSVSFALALQSLDLFGVCGTLRCQSSNWYYSESDFLKGSVVVPGRSCFNKYEKEIFGDTDTIQRGVQALDGIFLAVRRSVAIDVGFSLDIKGFTCYDIDFSYRTFLRGYRVGILGDLVLLHNSRVDDFSDEKLLLWQENQKILTKKFNFFRNFESYIRHYSVPYSLDVLP